MNYVGYLRISTSKQQASGLSVEAQRKNILDFIDSKPDANLIGEYIETESGGKNDRPKLAEAIAICKKSRATLLISRIDRLARSVKFVSNLMESGVRFIACDMPGASDFQIHIYSALAQEERRLISQRTKDALKAAKARGVILGKHGKILAEHNKAVAISYAKSLAPLIKSLKEEGFRTVRAIMTELNSRHISSPENGRWHLASTWMLLKRITII